MQIPNRDLYHVQLAIALNGVVMSALFLSYVKSIVYPLYIF